MIKGISILVENNYKYFILHNLFFHMKVINFKKDNYLRKESKSFLLIVYKMQVSHYSLTRSIATSVSKYCTLPYPCIFPFISIELY